MPTSRPRHAITETAPIAAALDAAARRWPEDGGNRSRLVVRLIAEGHRAIAAEADARRADRVGAVERTAGALAGVYGERYLDELREDWPE